MKAIHALWRCVGMGTLLILVSVVSGCAAAYNSRHELAPDKRDSVVCYVRGAYGRAYYRETDKKIIVSLYSHGPNDQRLLQKDFEEQKKAHPGYWVSHPIEGLEKKLLLEKVYHLKGSDVGWRPIWGPQNSVSLVFYDHGANCAGPGSLSPTSPERTLRMLRFTFDPVAGAYGEDVSPQ